MKFKELLKVKKESNEGVLSCKSAAIEGDTIAQKIEKLNLIKRNIEEVTSVSRCIAVCLVIVDNLHHEEVWRKWCEQSNESDYSAELYIHAKHPDRISSEWVRQRTLSYSFNPEWNSPEVIRAMLAVLSTALQDKNRVNSRFIFGTESCIPICTLQQAGAALFSCDMSWCDAYMVPKDSYEEAHCFDSVDRSIIPRKALPGWIMLNRRHSEEICSLPNLLRSDEATLVSAFNNVFAPEEVYFPTMLSVLSFLHSSHLNSRDEVMRRKVTFAEWEKKGDARPVQYPSIASGVISVARRNGSVFARKFTSAACPVDAWEREVRGCTQEVTYTSPDSNAGNNIREYGVSGGSQSFDKSRDDTSKRRRLDS